LATRPFVRMIKMEFMINESAFCDYDFFIGIYGPQVINIS